MNAASESEQTGEPKGSWATSLAFWCCLLIAAALYASVTLSPKLFTQLALGHEHYRNQVRLVELEQEVDYLQAVAEALRNDPQFAAELARVEFDAVRPGDERIPMNRSLSIAARRTKKPTPARLIGHPMHVVAIEFLATNSNARIGLLAAAATITVLAFACLHDSHPQLQRRGKGRARSCLGWLVARYRRTTAAD